MFPWIVIIALLGLLLLFAEVLMPGFGLFGILGTAMLLGALIVSFKLYGTTVFLLLLAALVIIFILMILFAKKSGLSNKVILQDKQEMQGFDESTLLGLLGRIGTTQTELKPFGVAEFDGQQVDVCSSGDFIDRGVDVQVVQITGKTVTVRVYTG